MPDTIAIALTLSGAIPDGPPVFEPGEEAAALLRAGITGQEYFDQLLKKQLFPDAVRFLACLLVLPVLIVISEIVGIAGGYLICITQANLPGTFYWHECINAIDYVAFFSSLIKAFFFAVIIAWICAFKGFYTVGGALGVGRFTTQAVAYSYIAVILSDTVLTKILLTIWG